MDELQPWEVGTSLPEDEELVLRAHHEAAHAVVAHHQRMRVLRLTLVEAEARTWHKDFVAGMEGWGGTEVDRARVALAGYLSDRSYDEQKRARDPNFPGFKTVGPHHDEQYFLAFIDKAIGGNLDAAPAIVEVFKLEVQEILRKEADRLNALAAALIKARALDEHQIRDVLVGPQPRDPKGGA